MLPANTIAIAGTRPPPPDLFRSVDQAMASLQSARAQELRAEIERCLTMAMRLAGSTRGGDEFRWILPPSLFPDTTIVLRRQDDGWTLDATTGDDEYRNVLANGIAELRDRFINSNLGDVLVTVNTSSRNYEPSVSSSEHT